MEILAVSLAGAISRNFPIGPITAVVMAKPYSNFLEHEAEIAEVLIAINQIDLLHRDLPRLISPRQTMAAPTGERAGLASAEFRDQQV